MDVNDLTGEGQAGIHRAYRGHAGAAGGAGEGVRRLAGSDEIWLGTAVRLRDELDPPAGVLQRP